MIGVPIEAHKPKPLASYRKAPTLEGRAGIVTTSNGEPMRQILRSTEGQTSVGKRRESDVSVVNPGVHMLLSHIKNQLVARGATGFLGLQRNLKTMDENMSGILSRAGFKKGLKDSKIKLDDKEMEVLFNHFDQEHRQQLKFENFLAVVRNPLNGRRRAVVEEAFRQLDNEGKGSVEADSIKDRYNAMQHPDVLSGRKTPEQCLREFLDHFEVGGEVEGKVTLPEFLDYYTNLGVAIDDDTYFELLLRNVWHLPREGTGATADTANR